MWMIAIFSAMLSLFAAHSFYIDYMVKEIPANANEAARDMGNFHVFALAAELYMRDHGSDTNFRPANATVVRWESDGAVIGLRHARGLPPGMFNVPINPNWRIQISGGSYILCTPMSIAGAVKMANLPQSRLWNPSIPWKQGNERTVPAVTFDVPDANAQACA